MYLTSLLSFFITATEWYIHKEIFKQTRNAKLEIWVVTSDWWFFLCRWQLYCVSVLFIQTYWSDKLLFGLFYFVPLPSSTASLWQKSPSYDETCIICSEFGLWIQFKVLVVCLIRLPLLLWKTFRWGCGPDLQEKLLEPTMLRISCWTSGLWWLLWWRKIGLWGADLCISLSA